MTDTLESTKLNPNCNFNIIRNFFTPCYSSTCTSKKQWAKTVMPHVTHHFQLDSYGAVAVLDIEWMGYMI
jgi:hypothetical protein